MFLRVGPRTFSSKIPRWICSCGRTEPVDRHELSDKVALWLCTEGFSYPDEFDLVRRSLRMNVRDLAKLLDVDKMTIVEWQKGRRRYTKYAAAVMAALYREFVDGRTTTRTWLMRSKIKPTSIEFVHLDAPTGFQIRLTELPLTEQEIKIPKPTRKKSKSGRFVAEDTPPPGPPAADVEDTDVAATRVAGEGTELDTEAQKR
jgi:DNA-binding XRE family transcriptional regulator